MITDVNFLDLLISSGIKVNSPAGDCPLLFSMCCIAMIQEKLIHENFLRDDPEERASHKRIIESLLNAGAYNFEVLARQRRWVRKVLGVKFTEIRPRCAWLLDLLAPHKRELSREIQSAIKHLFSEPVASVPQDNVRPPIHKSPDLDSKTSPDTNFNLIPAVELLAAYCGQAHTRLERALSFATHLFSKASAKMDVATVLLLYAAKSPFFAGSILDFLTSCKAPLPASPMEAVFIKGCERLDCSLIEKLLSLGVDANTRSSRGLALSVHSGVRSDSYTPPNLSTTKLLVERGANVQEAMAHLRLPYERSSPQATYLSIVEKLLDPSSPIYFNTLLPQNLRITGCDESKTQQRRPFKLLSHYAAAAVYLSAKPPAFEQLDVQATESLFQRLTLEWAAEMAAAKLSTSQAENEAQSAFISCTQHFHDLVSAFRDGVIIPALVSQIGPHAVARKTRLSIESLRHQIFPATADWLLGNLSLREVNRLLARWGKIRSSHPLGNRQNCQWYPLLPETEIAPTVTVKALSSYEELIKEGEAMNNCLRRGLGTTSCLLGAHHILSIRRQDSHLLNLTVTAEFGPAGRKPGKWRISEYAGRDNNKTPSAELMQYIHIFESRLSADDLPLHTGPFGQTEESLLSLEKTLATPIERHLSMELHAPPTEALAFYKARLCYKPDKWRQGSASLASPTINLSEITKAFAPFLGSLLTPD